MSFMSLPRQPRRKYAVNLFLIGQSWEGGWRDNSTAHSIVSPIFTDYVIKALYF